MSEEREEPDPEAGAVEERRHGPAEVGPPPIGHLPAQLRDGDADPGDLPDEVEDGDRRDDEPPRPSPTARRATAATAATSGAERGRGRRRPGGVERQRAQPTSSASRTRRG